MTPKNIFYRITGFMILAWVCILAFLPSQAHSVGMQIFSYVTGAAVLVMLGLAQAEYRSKANSTANDADKADRTSNGSARWMLSTGVILTIVALIIIAKEIKNDLMSTYEMLELGAAIIAAIAGLTFIVLGAKEIRRKGS